MTNAPTEPALPWRLARRAERMNPSVIREILKITERPGIISLAGGLPSPDTFPVEAMREASARVLRDQPREALQYAASEGYAPLREWVAAEMAAQGLAVDAAQVLITTGSQQGLDLVGKLLIDAGSTVAVESPTYLGALQAFAPYEPEVLTVACDDDGPLPAALGAARGARFLYLLPNFQNPSGRCMSEARRAALVDAAAAVGLPIVEDNPYGDLWFDAAPPPTLASRRPDATVYLGSFSKVLAPGLRLGYVIAPPALCPKLLQAKQAADLHTPGFNQRVVYEVIRDGFLRDHVPTIRARYRAQRDAMRAALERHLPAGCRWNVPSGGMFFWVELPEGIDATALLPRAVALGMAFVPGAGLLRQRRAGEHAAAVVRDRHAGGDRTRRRVAGAGAGGARAVSRAARGYRVLDVFTDTPLAGNPLAVVHDARGLDDAQMAALARWTNLSETAFLLPPTDAAADYRVRIFTPHRELPFAGHPTLGSCHAWLAAGGTAQQGGEVVQQCAAGLIRLRRSGARLAFAAPPCRRSGPLEADVLARIVGALGLAAADVVAHQWVDNGPGWSAVQLASAAAVLALRPDWAALAGLKLGVVGAHPAGGEVQFEVRALIGEGSGYEDPVTGSLNAGIAQWLIASGAAPERYVAAQGAALQRRGRVHVERADGEVWIGGDCVVCVEGTLTL